MKITIKHIALGLGLLTLNAMTYAEDKLSEGKALASKSGCFSCHNVERKIVGPAWKDVAKRYQNDENVRDKLILKVKKGGAGNWTAVTGGMPMPPNSPRVSDADITRLVDFILSLPIDSETVTSD